MYRLLTKGWNETYLINVSVEAAEQVPGDANVVCATTIPQTAACGLFLQPRQFRARKT
jgi:hypothetical protein